MSQGWVLCWCFLSGSLTGLELMTNFCLCLLTTEITDTITSSWSNVACQTQAFSNSRWAPYQLSYIPHPSFVSKDRQRGAQSWCWTTTLELATHSGHLWSLELQLEFYRHLGDGCSLKSYIRSGNPHHFFMFTYVLRRGRLRDLSCLAPMLHGHSVNTNEIWVSPSI